MHAASFTLHLHCMKVADADHRAGCAGGGGEDVDAEARALAARRPFLEIRGELLHHNPSILYFSSISIVQQAGLCCVLAH